MLADDLGKIKEKFSLAYQARWVYILGVVLVGVVTKISQVANVNFNLVMMMLLTTTAIGYNLLPRLYLGSINNGRRIIWLIGAQFFLDILFVTIILHFAGGIESISFIFYFFVIVSSSFVYDRFGVYLVSIFSAILFNALIYGEYFGVINHYTRYGFSSYELHSRIEVVLINTFTVSMAILATGFYVGYLSYLRYKHEEEVLQEKNRRLLEVKKTEEIRGGFVTVLTHQFRTPLTHIKLALSALMEKENTFDEEQKGWIHESWSALGRLITLVDRLVKMKDLEQKNLPIRRNLMEINGIIEGCVENLEYLALEKKISVTIDAGGEKNIFIKGDPNLLPSVIESLIQNAIDYGQENSQVEIRITRESGNCLIAVANQGIGIDNRDKRKIFTQFFRSKQALHTETDKSGLSLYLSKLIVKKHHGKIWFESNDGQKTVFYLELPLADEA